MSRTQTSRKSVKPIRAPETKSKRHVIPLKHRPEHILSMEDKCWERRAGGWTLREIAVDLGIGVSTVQDHCNRVLDRLAKENKEMASKWRDAQLSQLSTMLKAIWADVKKGNTFAIDRALKIMERHAKLTGCDVPLKIEASVVKRVIGVDEQEI